MIPARWIVTAAVPLLAAAMVSAQQGRGGQAQQEPPKTFRSATHFITTDVIVRDSRGRFIPGLTTGDFEILEDGVPQTLSHFSAVRGGQHVAEVPPPAPTRREGLILPPTAAAAPVGRIFIIFIDDLHLQPSDAPRARQVLEQIRDRLVQEDDLIAIVSTGYSAIEIDLSYDPKKRRLTESINRVSGSGQTPAEIINAAQTREGPAGLRHNAYVAFRTAFGMLDQVKEIRNRRKAFIYVSSGYDFNPFTNARFKKMQEAMDVGGGLRDETGANRGGLSAADMNRHRNPLELNGQQFSDADLTAALVELTKAARLANVTFYTMDPRGLMAGPDISVSLSPDEWSRFVTTTDSSLRLLAEETGGFCACQRNEFLSAIRQIDSEMSDYYMLGYTSTNGDTAKVYRRIEIRLRKHKDAALIYKEGYRIQR